MTVKQLVLSLPPLFVLCAVAPAQPPSVPKVPAPGTASREMQEDVAVFRVLLHRTLARHYGLPAPTDKAHDAVAHGFHQLPLAEGVYLKGHGVVFTVSAATPFSDPLGQTDLTAKTLSAWEKALQELRGEKRPADAKPEKSLRGSLSEVLLQLLAENGRHFKQLSSEERLTVAVTFRTSQDCMKCHAASFANDLAGYLDRPTGKGGPGLFGAKPPHINAPSQRAVPPGSSAGAPPGVGMTLPAEGSNDQLLGDLMFKQGRYREAEEAYARAIRKFDSVLGTSEKPEAKLRRYLQAAEVASLLAQAAAALGDNDKAKRALDMTRRLAEAASKLSDEMKAGKPPGHLPAQLVISATKQQLDQVATNKLSAEEFRKAISIEHRTVEAPR